MVGFVPDYAIAVAGKKRFCFWSKAELLDLLDLLGYSWLSTHLTSLSLYSTMKLLLIAINHYIYY